MPSTIVVMQPSCSVFEVIRTAKLKGGLFVVVMHSHGIPQGLPYGTAIEHIDQFVHVDNWDDRENNLLRLQECVAIDDIVGTYAGLESTLEWNAYLRIKLGLPTTAPEDIRLLLNKEYVRKTLYENGLSKIKSYSQQEVSTWVNWPLSKNVYFKPVNGGGSSYVYKLCNFEQLTQAINGWNTKACVNSDVVRRYLEKSNQYFIEEEIIGELMSLEGLVLNGTYHSIGLTSRATLKQNEVVEIGFGFPYKHEKELEIIKLVAEAHKLFKFIDGPSHTEVIVTAAGEVEIVEINARLVGLDVLMAIQKASDKDYTELLLKNACGIPIAIDEIKAPENKFSYLQYLMAPQGVGVFDAVKFGDHDDIVFTRVIAQKGQSLKSIQQENTLAGFIVVSNSFEQAKVQAHEVARNSTIKIEAAPLY